MLLKKVNLYINNNAINKIRVLILGDSFYYEMSRYLEAKNMYAIYGIDTEKALETLKNVNISVHCWQGDDVIGFDGSDSLSGGIQTTGNYPGKARTPDELMADIDKAFSLIPGKKKINLHASYAIFDGNRADRDALKP